MKKHLGLLLGLALTLLCGTASAQFAKPEDAIKYRKNSLFVMQQHVARLAAMAQGKTPFDAKAAAENAALVETLSKLPWQGFVEGTDKGETKASPDIWKNAAKFKEAADKFQAEATKLSAAAKTGKVDDLKAALGNFTPTCKACHDDFRLK